VGMRIVLADDDRDLRAIYAEVLRRDGHEVFEAADGHEALGLVERLTPDLLLLDIWMPVVSGFEVLDQLRYSPCSTTMKVVMLSNLSDAETRLEGFSGGVADYWVKGLPLDEFGEKVRRLLAAAPVGSDPP
jgi:DNA-binding response OmpR family regulator